ncbi:hypothetical protein SDC9_169994 [bioreactor metagenome]|uniref:Uncharacterized protein n=1 Tax=bioreactor metagenome TaxID=1076179 RepID=A0A645G6U3_9ZZZZ
MANMAEQMTVRLQRVTFFIQVNVQKDQDCHITDSGRNCWSNNAHFRKTKISANQHRGDQDPDQNGHGGGNQRCGTVTDSAQNRAIDNINKQ